jgi:hypothetical protein
MSETRISTSRYLSKWPELTRIYGRFCVYCGFNYATSIDHVLPISYKRDDSIENLRPACMDCNLIASGRVFEDFEAKQWYILEQRKKRRWQRKQAVCTDCKLPYIYLMQSPSLFLCPECYDIEYETELSKTDDWLRWLTLLVRANINVEEATERREEIKCERDKKLGKLRLVKK